MPEREPRDSQTPDKILLTPFDVTKFGSEEDPCFGKLYDLNADECHICGDVELCSIAFMQTSRVTRTALEAEHKYKDLEEADMIKYQKVREFIDNKRLEGWGDQKISSIALRTFAHLKLTKDQIKILL